MASTIRGARSTRQGSCGIGGRAKDAATFKKRAEVLGAQYSKYEPLPGVKVNGELTMGENIADLGGLTLALDAYRASLKGKACACP